jgi:glycosyltransferase involved in cell wall biosynthesis
MLVNTTLFIRHLDSTPDELVASALGDAERRGLSDVTLFFSHEAEPERLVAVLQHECVGSTGTKDTQMRSSLPPELLNDPRVGRYWEPGAWSLPEPADHVYFIGPWRLITPAMLREALRRGVLTLRVRVAVSWGTVPLAPLRFARALVRAAAACTGTLGHVTGRLLHPLRHGSGRLVRTCRGNAARALVLARPGWAGLAARVAGPSGVTGGSLQRAFAHMLKRRPPSVAAIRGRIVLVCGNLAPGGAERQVTYTLQGLAARKCDTTLVCHNLTGGTTHRYDFYLPTVHAAGVQAREIKHRAGWLDFEAMPPGLKEVARLLPPGLANDIANLHYEFVELRPQVVHTWLDWDNVRGGLAAALAGVPRIVVSGRNINPSNFALYQPYMDPAYRVLAKLPNVMLINNSRAGANDYADWIGIQRHQIGVIYNAVDFGGRMRLPSNGRAALRASLGIPHSAFLVGGVFRLEAEKRPLLWVETAALLARQVPDMHFVMFGQGSMREEVLQAAKREGIAERLIVAGVTNDILSAMSIMDVFLLASFGEGLPNVLLEAQWVGTPVVVTDVGGSKEAVEPGVTGWPIATDSAAELAARIKWLHDNPTVRKAARVRGPEWVREQFGVERMVTETLQAYALQSSPVLSGPERVAADASGAAT